jgi:molecular chaperone IbpA
MEMSTAFDLSPLYRSMIGVDRMADVRGGAERRRRHSYPPFDVEKTGQDSYRVTLAAAGFSRPSWRSAPSPICW